MIKIIRVFILNQLSLLLFFYYCFIILVHSLLLSTLDKSSHSIVSLPLVFFFLFFFSLPGLSHCWSLLLVFLVSSLACDWQPLSQPSSSVDSLVSFSSPTNHSICSLSPSSSSTIPIYTLLLCSLFVNSAFDCGCDNLHL